MADLWDSWLPGVLSRRQLRALCERGYIGHVEPEEMDQIDHSSLDLHITDDAYRLTRGSVKPFGDRFLHQIQGDGLGERIRLDGDGCFVLRPRNTYLFRLRECLEGLGDSFWGQATAKSSVGRLDVLARLIVNGMDHYEAFRPKMIGQGRTDMFVEVTPITFPVKVKVGTALNQLRLFYGDRRASEIHGQEVLRTCFAGDEPKSSPTLAVDLSEVDTDYGIKACGFSASVDTNDRDPIPLWVDENKPDPSAWWEVVESDDLGRVRITHDRFYIFRSIERLTLPAGIAVYARATDEEIGEMRIHYAGFVHPNFGRQDAEEKGDGTPLIFEVRGHNVDVSLRQSEILARLQFFRMSEDSRNEPGEEGSYSSQGLNLSKYFSNAWSSPPRRLSPESGQVRLEDGGNDA